MKPLHLGLVTAILLSGFSSAEAIDLEKLRRQATPTWFRASHEPETIFRAQSADDGGVPVPAEAGVTPETGTMDGSTITGDGSFTAPTLPETSTWNAFSPPVTPDPFVSPAPYGAQPMPYAPYSPYGMGAAPAGGYATFGANGPQPFRYGWQNRLDISWMPETGVNGSPGNFEQFGVDYDLAYTGPFVPGWMLTFTNEFKLRSWDGPSGGAGLPGSAFRFGWDFELETPQSGPFSVAFGITPSINSDLDASLSSDAFQLDGRGIVLFQLDQWWTLALGAQYWDRVNDRVIPYGGLIYRDDFWEWRLMYPEARISLFLGNEPYWAKWMYVRSEYHVEAYEITAATVPRRDEVELEDWRVMIGFKMDAGYYNWFIEGGWVFDRKIDYSSALHPSVDPSTAFMLQMGWRF